MFVKIIHNIIRSMCLIWVILIIVNFIIMDINRSERIKVENLINKNSSFFCHTCMYVMSIYINDMIDVSIQRKRE